MPMAPQSPQEGHTSRVLPVRAAVQHYAWGKRGMESVVAQLSPNLRLAGDEPCAELWMGTHVSGPSHVDLGPQGCQLLSDYLKENPEALGDNFIVEFSSEPGLPFLFKVLSVRVALSIQAHPDKVLAEKLHARYPDIYKDDNHKPEMACALTDFEALCEFRPMREIAAFLATVPELRALVGEEAAAKFEGEAGRLEAEDVLGRRSALQAIYTRLMTRSPEAVAEQVGRLVGRLRAAGALSGLEELALRVEGQHPGDVGVFSLFFLNHVTLKPGEALFLGPNLPHAYLSGDCVEIMATSDNVVRAGLTPKFKDVATLCSMLTYEDRPATVLRGEPAGPHTLRYAPAVREFALHRTALPPHAEAPVPAAPLGPSLLLVVDGACTLHADGGGGGATAAPRGAVLLVPCGAALTARAGPAGALFFVASAGLPAACIRA